MANYYYDSFDRTGSSLGTSEAPWVEDSGAWETVGGAEAASKGSGGRAALDLGSPNQLLEFDWILPNANELPEVNFRSDNGLTSGSYYKLRYFGNAFGDGASVSRVVSGSATSLGYNGPFGNTNATKKWNIAVWDMDASTVRIAISCAGAFVHEYLDTTSRLTSGNYMFIQHALSSAPVKFGYMTARAAEAQNAFPQAASLKGQWKLDEAAGANNAIDTSGNSHDLTQVSSPGSTTGIQATARTFDGTNDWFTLADHADFSPTSKFTFNTWVYRTQTSICMASKWNFGGGGSDGWGFQPARVYVGTSTEFTYTGAGTSSWDMYTLVVDMTQSTDATKVKVYCNGAELTKGGSPTVALNDTNDEFHLGHFGGSIGRPWNGNIDLSHFWKDVALTQAEIRDLFNAGDGLVYSQATFIAQKPFIVKQAVNRASTY